MDRSVYEAMSHDQLVARLKVAEDTLVLVGWSSSTFHPDFESERSKAAEQMWQMWCAMVGGSDFCDPKLHPELDEMIPALAAQRDAVRSRTLRQIEKQIRPLHSDDTTPLSE